MKKRVKSILLIFILFFLLLPLLQQNLSLFAFDPLYGYYNLRDKPQLKWFTWERWFSDKFQDTLSKSLQDHVVFRELLIRLNNQYKLNLFDETDMKNIVVGKENYLFEEGYILEYLGRNFTGKTYIDEKLRRTKWVQDYLKREKNIDLIIVFEPGRASFFPEFIPERYQPQHKTLSNYQYYAQRCKGLDIHNLDLNAYFLSMKTTSPFPLYPKYGVHWSTYGMTLAMDTLIHYIENTRNIDMPEVICNNIISSTEYSDIDWDIEKSMNLLYKLPQSEAMAHLEITFNNDAHKTKPDILTIGDSYCWSIFNAEIPHHLYKNTDYWYYNHTIYPNYWDATKCVEQLNLKEEIEKRDVLLIMITELNMHNAFWGFTDQLYNLYCRKDATNSFYHTKRLLISADKDLTNTRKEAEAHQISVEQILNLSTLKEMTKK